MKNKGITIIALIITIVILLILAGITIGTLVGDNGLIKTSKKAKDEAEISNEKEILEKAIINSMADNKFGVIEQQNLQENLNKEIGEEKSKVETIRKKIVATFTNSGRSYYVDEDGNIIEYVYKDLPKMQSGENFQKTIADYKEKIITIKFLDNKEVPKDTETVFDVSEKQDESVKAWLIKNNENLEYYDLYIGGEEGVEASSCKNMFSSFKNCKEIDLDNFYTEKITIFSYMFANCSNLEKINLKNLETSNAKDMRSFLAGCAKLKEVDLSHFDTSNVYDMNGMFYGCAFETLDISTFDTSKVTDMGNMFRQCSNLVTIYVGREWSTEKVTNGTRMFEGNTKLFGKIGYDGTKVDITYANYENGYLTYKE